MKHFLSVRDMNREAILETLRVAADMKGAPAKYATSLAGKTLAMVFEKPSLRTRASFDIGIQQLGGYALSLQPTEIQLGKVLMNLGRLDEAARLIERVHSSSIAAGREYHQVTATQFLAELRLVQADTLLAAGDAEAACASHLEG